MDPSHLFEAQHRLLQYLPPTPLLPSPALARLANAPVYLKLETQQPTGSFKVRPAFNGILAELELAHSRGVITSSSGNFAQAVAYAAKMLDCSAHIVMTSNTSPYKIERTRALGAEVTLCEPTFEARWETTHRLQKETGRLLLHPYDSLDTIAADGTIALELLTQLEAAAGEMAGSATLVAPVSGGGLLAGIALAARHRSSRTRVIGVQPELNPSMSVSFLTGQRVHATGTPSIADALVAVVPGERTFELVKKHADDILLVTEAEIRAALRFLLEEQKLVVEPGAAVGVAALLAGKLEATQGAPLAFVLSGGNVPLDRLAALTSP